MQVDNAVICEDECFKLRERVAKVGGYLADVVVVEVDSLKAV